MLASFGINLSLFCYKTQKETYNRYSVAKDRNPRYLVVYAFSITHVFCSNLLTVSLIYFGMIN